MVADAMYEQQDCGTISSDTDSRLINPEVTKPGRVAFTAIRGICHTVSRKASTLILISVTVLSVSKANGQLFRPASRH